MSENSGARDRQKSGREPDGLYIRTLADIEREEIEWLWPDRVPLGMLTLLAGDPGLGKSLLTIDLAAKVSQADGHVLLLSAEDHAGATIRPRAEAAGADMRRIHVVGARRDGMEDGISLPDDAEELDRLVARHDVRLIVVDPLSAHLPQSVNSWRDQSVRRALAPLHRLAEERGCAVVVVAHPNKGKGNDPLYRTGGSIAIPAAVRSALLLARDPADPDGDRGQRRILAHYKSNISELAGSLLCQVEGIQLDSGGETARLQIIGKSGIGATELLDRLSSRNRTKHEEAIDLLRAKLADGPRSTKELQAAAKQAGIGWRTVEAAKSALEIRATKQKGQPDGNWSWTLPEGTEDRKADISNPAVFNETALGSHSTDGVAVEDRKAADADKPPAKSPDDQLIDAAEVARRLRVSRDYVYRHKVELGVVRFGDGPKARLRFDPAKVADALGALSDRKSCHKRSPVRPVRSRHEVTLLPIRAESP